MIFKKTKRSNSSSSSSSSKKKRNVILVGIKVDDQSCKELLGWALAKASETGYCVVMVHVCRSSVQTVKQKPIVDSYLEAYEELCDTKKVELVSQVLTGRSIRRALVKEAKNHETVAVVVGSSKPNNLGVSNSIAKYCAKKLPPSTDVVAINKGKIVYRRFPNNEHQGLAGNDDSRPSVSQVYSMITRKMSRSEFGDSEVETEIVKPLGDTARLQVSSLHGNKVNLMEELKIDLKEELKVVHNRSATSLSLEKPSAQKSLGWPLRRARSVSVEIPGPRNMSVVQWVMSLPDRSPQPSPRCLTIIEEASYEGGIKRTASALDDLPEELTHLLQTNRCRWFSHEVLKTATSRFSSEKLIGKGGCNLVFEGNLPDGQKVAVKLMKSSKAIWTDFAHEVDIISSLKHDHIMPLIGFCFENNALISVYDFSTKGSLEENLHGRNKGLSWEVRYNVAVGIAEALNYLHNECSPPVIHRDVKTSNILLTKELEPQLSDFGLAIWGPTSMSSSLTECDVVGTFGYLAPEYFMYGKISDKIDVYAFGVVLLELLSGRKPIGSETDKEQESLVMWAMPRLETGDVHDVLDPNFEGRFDEIQVLRMLQAAKQCLTRSARLRPNISEIVKLLKGDPDLQMHVSCSDVDDSEIQDDNDDEVYPNSSAKLHLNLAMRDVDDDDTASFSSIEHNNLSWEDYLKGRWSRSSSFD